MKAMFSQVSVCPREGGLCLCPGGLYPGGSLARRSLSMGVSVCGFLSRGLCPGVSVKGVSVQGGLCLGGSLSRKGVYV